MTSLANTTFLFIIIFVYNKCLHWRIALLYAYKSKLIVIIFVILCTHFLNIKALYIKWSPICTVLSVTNNKIEKLQYYVDQTAKSLFTCIGF